MDDCSPVFPAEPVTLGVCFALQFSNNFLSSLREVSGDAAHFAHSPPCSTSARAENRFGAKQLTDARRAGLSPLKKERLSPVRTPKILRS